MQGTLTTTTNSPRPGYKPTSASDVMSYLHSLGMTPSVRRIVSRQLNHEVERDNLLGLKERLREIKQLKRGWDGYEAMPTNRRILSFVEHLLEECSPRTLADWSLSPDVNATIILEKDNAVINIGQDEFSYAAEAATGHIGESHLPVSTESVIRVINTINSYAD